MPKKDELKKLARARLKEAKVLAEKGLYDGAYYLAGYTIEMALKARICKILDIDLYPKQFGQTFKTHNLDNLLILSGLAGKFAIAKSNNRSLFTNWSLVTDWSEEYRYKPVGTNSKQNAQEIITALDDPVNGVFTWIKKYW